MEIRIKNGTRTLFILACTLISIIPALIFESGAIIFCIMIFALVTSIFIRNEELVVPAIIAFILITTITIIITCGEQVQYGEPYYLGGSDDLNFENYARLCITNGYYSPMQVYKHFYWYNSVGYLWFLSWIMRLADFFGGYVTIIGRFANVFLLIILSTKCYEYFISKNIFSYKENIKIFYIVALFPNMIYITGHVFRDILSVLCVYECFYLSEKILQSREKKEVYDKNTYISVLLIILFVALAMFVRVQNIMIIGLLIFVNYFFRKKMTRNRLLSLIIFGILCGVFILNIFITELNTYTSYYYSYMSDRQDGLSHFIWSLPLFPFGVVVRSIYGLVSPFPNALVDIFRMFDSCSVFINVLISLGVLFQIYKLPYLLKNIAYNRDQNTFFWAINFLIVVSTTFTFRHFCYIYPFFWPLVYREYYLTDKSQKKKCFVFVSLLFIFLAIIYTVVRGG